MPLYEYVCSDCNIKFDQLRPVGRMNEPASCPQGHSWRRPGAIDVRRAHEGRVRRGDAGERWGLWWWWVRY